MMDYVSWFRPLFRRRPTFADCLPWHELLDVATGLLTTVDDGMMSTIWLSPHDVGSLSNIEQGILSLHINQAFLRASGVWAYWIHGRRYAVPAPPASTWPDPMSEHLDAAYRASLGVRYDMDHYVTVWHRRLSPTTRFFERLLFPDESAPPDAQAQLRQSFTAGLTQLMTHLSSTCHELVRLDGEALLTYLHRHISIYEQRVAVPSTRTDIREYLAKDCKLWPGTRLTLGPHKHLRHYIRALTLTEDLPAESHANMWAKLYEVPFAYDWSTRVVPIDTRTAAAEAEKEKIDRYALRKSGRTLMYEYVARKDTGHDLDDEYSLAQMRDASALRHAMLAQQEAQVHQVTTFLVRGPDARLVDAQILEIQTLLQTYGCIVTDEGLNCTEAFFGTMPGQMHTGWRHPKRSGRPNVRELRLTTKNLAHMGPWHKPYTGEAWIPRLRGPALMQAVTDGSTVFGLSPYVGDVGHCKKVGPNGAGKSTELAWEGMQWGRYEGSQLFSWDMGGSSRAMTLCLGGTYRDIWLDGLDIQLFAHLDRPGESGWLYQWILNRITEAGVPKHPDIAKFVWGILEDMVKHPNWPRSLEDYLNLLLREGNKIAFLARSQGNERSRLLAQQYPLIDGALRPFARSGVYGHLVDAREDRFSLSRLQTFDVMALSDVDSCYPGVLEALFHRILGVCHGQPVRCHFDEAHHYFTHPTFVSILKRHLPWMRRNNYSAVFAVQTVEQYAESPLASLLLKNCLTDHYFPDAMAESPLFAPLYTGMGLTPTDRHIISRATPKEHMYVVKQREGDRSPGGRRLISVRLPPIAAAVCGSNSPEDHQLMDTLLDHYGAEEFPFRFLDAKGFPDDAATIRQALAHRSLDCPLAPVIHAVAD